MTRLAGPMGSGDVSPSQLSGPAGPSLDNGASPATVSWRSRLFPTRATPSLTRSRVLWAALAVVAGATLSLGRIGGPGPFNSIWAEDASNFLTDAFSHSPWTAITTPFNGYYHIGPRLLAEIASHAPVRWAPAVLSIEAALVAALIALIAYVASGAYLRSTAARLLVSVPVVLMPTAENWAATTTNDVATLQFFAVYALFWILLWVPNSRAGRVTAVVAVGLTAFSTPIAVVFLPLALVRLYVRRGLPELLMALLIAAGTATHLTALGLGLTERPPNLKANPDVRWGLEGFARWGLPHEIFGYRWLGDPALSYNPDHLRWIGLAWLGVLGALVVALIRWSRPAWGLAGMAAAFSVGLLLFQIMASGATEERYTVGPGLLLVVSFVALLQPSDKRFGAVPFIAYATMLTVVIAVNYRLPAGRTSGPRWDERLRVGVEDCKRYPDLPQVNIFTSYVGAGWNVAIPCHKLR